MWSSSTALRPELHVLCNSYDDSERERSHLAPVAVTPPSSARLFGGSRADGNDDPKPFVWTATAEEILKKVRRGRVALDQLAS